MIFQVIHYVALRVCFFIRLALETRNEFRISANEFLCFIESRVLTVLSGSDRLRRIQGRAPRHVAIAFDDSPHNIEALMEYLKKRLGVIEVTLFRSESMSESLDSTSAEESSSPQDTEKDAIRFRRQTVRVPPASNKRFASSDDKCSTIDMLMIVSSNPHLSDKFITIPDYVPRSAISYAELLIIRDLSERSLEYGVESFTRKSQRFGK